MMGSGYERRDSGTESANSSGSGTKIRVYELAKEFGMAPKDLVTKIRNLGMEVANHMSNLDGADADRIRRTIERERQESLVEERLSETVIRRRSRSATAAVSKPAAPTAPAPLAARPASPPSPPAPPAPVIEPPPPVVETVEAKPPVPPPPPAPVVVSEPEPEPPMVEVHAPVVVAPEPPVEQVEPKVEEPPPPPVVAAPVVEETP